MAGDGGFERTLVNRFNNAFSSDNYLAYRRKQSRFAKQDIDVLIDSKLDKLYMGVECKSMKIDVDKACKNGNSSEAKLYFSDAFSTDKDGVHQIEHITDFLNKTGRKGVLAVAYRRGKGRKVHYYALPWEAVVELYNKDSATGIEKQVFEDKGVELSKDNDFKELAGV